MPRPYENVRQDRQSLQTDPIGYEDDLNLYAYVRNDPLNLTDPSGQRPPDEDIQAARGNWLTREPPDPSPPLRGPAVPADVSGGTREERSFVRDEASRVFNTERGRELADTLNEQGRTVEIEINCDNRNRRIGDRVEIDPDSAPTVQTTEGPQPASAARYSLTKLTTSRPALGMPALGAWTTYGRTKNP